MDISPEFEMTWGAARELVIQKHLISFGRLPDEDDIYYDMRFGDMVKIPEDQPMSDRTIPDDTFEDEGEED